MTATQDYKHTSFEMLERAARGEGAVIVQPYTEVNSKTGRQYEVAFFLSSLAASGVAYLIMEVGSSAPLAIKNLFLKYNSEMLSYQLFKSPTYVGSGTELDIYNFNDANAVAEDVVIRSGITPSNDGTAVGPKVYSLGSQGAGNRLLSSVTQDTGIERILEAGSTYALKIINEDSSNASAIAGTATWFQGELDFPRP